MLLSFPYFYWLFRLSARETSSGNRSFYKSTWDRAVPFAAVFWMARKTAAKETREKVYSKSLYGRWRLRLMGSRLHSNVYVQQKRLRKAIAFA